MSGLAIVGLLTSDAQTHTRDGLTPRLRNLDSALGAVARARTAGQLILHAAHTIFDGSVDLILHCAVAGPTRCHICLTSQFSRCSRPYSGLRKKCGGLTEDQAD